MTFDPVSFPRHRFPAAFISHAVWLYHVSRLGLRNVELILAERGVVVTHRCVTTATRHPSGGQRARRARPIAVSKLRSRRISRAALRPGLPDTPPPGWVPAPHI
jgi:putative transposase